MKKEVNYTEKVEKKVVKVICKKIERLQKKTITPYKKAEIEYWQLIKDKILNGDL